MVGDGSFGFNTMELDTAARFGLPIVTVIMNNRGWSASWVPLGVRHYERMAGAFDGEGFFVEQPDQIGPALDAAFAATTPIDRQRDARLRRRVLPRPLPRLRTTLPRLRRNVRIPKLSSQTRRGYLRKRAASSSRRSSHSSAVIA